MDKKQDKLELDEVGYVKRVSIGSVNPNNILSDEAIDAQMQALNQYLNDYPKGRIIGKDITIGRFAIGQHELTMERTTYHIAFKRKPEWIQD